MTDAVVFVEKSSFHHKSFFISLHFFIAKTLWMFFYSAKIKPTCSLQVCPGQTGKALFDQAFLTRQE